MVAEKPGEIISKTGVNLILWTLSSTSILEEISVDEKKIWKCHILQVVVTVLFSHHIGYNVSKLFVLRTHDWSNV